MKILILNSSDANGGAARAAYRLHLAFLKENMDSTMLVHEKKTDDFSVVGPKTKISKALPYLRKELDKLPLKFYKNRTRTLFYPAWVPFSRINAQIEKINPDIVLLHWINGGMLRIEDLSKIRQAVFLTMHDMWSFTGGCHYDEGCGEYVKKCGKCIVLGSSRTNDLSRKVFLRKQRVYNRIPNLTVIGLSSWIANCAKESSLLKKFEVVNIPNPIDTEKFKPIEISVARGLLNLPLDKKLVLYGAMNSTGDPRKGFKELVKAINKLDIDDVEFVVFGSGKPEVTPKIKYKTHYLGHIFDDLTLSIVYSASNVMVVPSLQENLSNAIMESTSCGTPVVAFNIGGNKDMIEHKETGYLAKPFDAKDMASGIEWVLHNSNRKKIEEENRKRVINNFSEAVVVQKYLQLFKDYLK